MSRGEHNIASPDRDGTPVKGEASSKNQVSGCLPSASKICRLSKVDAKAPGGLIGGPSSCSSIHAVEDATNASISPGRLCQEKVGTSSLRKYHSVSVVRLMAPIEPLPLVKSSLFAPFVVARADFPSSAPVETPAFRSNQRGFIINDTPMRDVYSPTKVSSATKVHKAIASNLSELSPDATPRKSLPPHDSYKREQQEQPMSGKATRTAKSRLPFEHYDASPDHSLMPVISDQSRLGRKAASVADLRKLFDRPRPSNMSTLSVPKIVPPNTFGAVDPAVKFAYGHIKHADVTKQKRHSDKENSFTAWTQKHQHEKSSSQPHKINFPNYGGNLQISEDTNDSDTELNRLGSIPKSRLRAFVRGKSSSGSWRRMASRLQRRFSRDHDFLREQSHGMPLASRQMSETTNGPSNNPSYTLDQAFNNEVDSGRNVGHLSQLTAKHEPRRAWVWGHVHRATQQTGSIFQDSMATKGSSTSSSNSIFRRISKEHSFRSWSWGHQRTKKETSPIGIDDGFFDSQNSCGSSDNAEMHAKQMDHVSLDAEAANSSGLSSAIILNSEAGCELQHPRPVRVDGLQQLVSLE